MTKIGANFFKNVTTLKTVTILYNEILVLERDAFKELKTVETLILESNSLKQLPPKIFKYNKKLRKLSINHNELQKLDEDLLEELRELRVFSAAGNKLVEIPLRLFRTNKKLKELNLADNNIKELQIEVFAGLSLQEIDVSRNDCTNFTNTATTRLFNENGIADWVIESRFRDCMKKIEVDIEVSSSTVRTLSIFKYKNKGKSNKVEN